MFLAHDDVAFKTRLQTLIQTSIYSSILKIIASNFQNMLLGGSSGGSTLQTHHKFDYDLYSHRVPFVKSWPICINLYNNRRHGSEKRSILR